MAVRSWRTGMLAAVAGTMLAACLPQVRSGSVPTPAELPPNTAPSISGTPPASAIAGSAYAFQPAATDADGDALQFTATGLPGWATLVRTSGMIHGTPTEQDVGTSASIVLTVTDGEASSSLAPFSITVASSQPTPPPPPGNSAPNRAPSVSGTPATTATVGSDYVFRPVASDPDGDAVSWSISGKPTTAEFSTLTGELRWNPGSAGTWQNVVITATDSRGASASLPAFSIVVTQPSVGTAALSWEAPRQYADGQAMPASALAAYRIYHGASATSLSRLAEVDGGTTSFNVDRLSAGTHYFAVTAVSYAGAESEASTVASKTIQ